MLVSGKLLLIAIPLRHMVSNNNSKTLKERIKAHHTSALIKRSAKYNGYTNYQTWCVYNWLTNNKEVNEVVIETIAEAENREDELRNLVEDMTIEAKAGLSTDLLTDALDEVNWTELVNSFKEEVDE